MPFLSCTWLSGFYPYNGAVSRVLPGGRPGEAASVQSLVACGEQLQLLTGADALIRLELGPPLQLYAEPAARDGERAAARRPYVPQCPLQSPVWDPHSSAIYMVEGFAIVRLSCDDTVTVVAGSVVERGDIDGPGGAARFRRPRTPAVDGAGSLYVADGARVRKLQLPGVGPGAGALGAAHAGAPSAAAQAAAAAGAAAAAAPAAAGGEVLVSTLPQNLPGLIWGLAYDDSRCSSGSLLFATDCALYRLPPGDPTAAPLLLAGSEGVSAAVDDVGADARFQSICGIALDGEGSAYVADWAASGSTSLRRVAVDGTVSTVAAALPKNAGTPTILPNGCVTMSGIVPGGFHVLSLGLKLPACHAAAAQLLPPAAPTGRPPRTLPADLGALLDRQPDGTADVTIVVGGRTFHAHRVLLSARSDYFKQRLEGGFADGSTQQLSLPDADPDAFELWLRFIYMGAVDIPAALAAAVAELADRLLLPELREQAAAVMEASVSASTVAGLLLWAEARGPAFSEVLSRLKAWYVANHEAVMREAAAEVGLLAERSPKLFFELTHEACYQRPAKRPRAN